MASLGGQISPHSDGCASLAREVIGTARCSLSHRSHRLQTVDPARRFATSTVNRSGLCCTASSERTWPRSWLKPPIAIPAAICRPSSPKSSIGICAAASFATASSASAVPLAATSCSSPSHVRTEACVRPAAPGAWPILPRIFGTTFCPRSPCASGFSLSRSDFDFYWPGGPSTLA